MATGVPIFSVSLTQHHLHGSAIHHDFYFDHFVKKSAEAAQAVQMIGEMELYGRNRPKSTNSPLNRRVVAPDGSVQLIFPSHGHSCYHMTSTAEIHLRPCSVASGRGQTGRPSYDGGPTPAVRKHIKLHNELSYGWSHPSKQHSGG
jgi:hypothetical protein